MAKVSAHREEWRLTSPSQARSTGLQVKCLQGWSTLQSDGCSAMSCSTRLQTWGVWAAGGCMYCYHGAQDPGRKEGPENKKPMSLLI